MKRIPNLKKLEYGEYLYKNLYHIYCGGYDRIIGCTRWYARLDKGDFKTLAEGDTLSEVVYHVDCLEKKGDAK